VKVKDLLRSILSTAKLMLLKNQKRQANPKPAETKVIISLTSIPARINVLHLCIQSLLRQDTEFQKIILWLNHELKDSIPKNLSTLSSDKFDIRFCSTSEPHRKLVETLKIYPDLAIVTCDDDMIYPKDWLQRLLAEHYRYPKAIVAHMCRQIRIDDKQILPYRKWHGETPGRGSKLTVALGWGGVLYPANSLHSMVIDRERYMKLAPKADDLWFKCMSLINATDVRKTSYPDPEPVPIIGSQMFSLSKDNIDRDENRAQLLNLVEEFKIDFYSDTRADNVSDS